MRKIQPLTPKEQLYAEKHHEMIYHFLSHYQLDETEYYDVVVFGYLAATWSGLGFSIMSVISYRFSSRGESFMEEYF